MIGLGAVCVSGCLDQGTDDVCFSVAHILFLSARVSHTQDSARTWR